MELLGSDGADHIQVQAMGEEGERMVVEMASVPYASMTSEGPPARITLPTTTWVHERSVSATTCDRPENRLSSLLGETLQKTGPPLVSLHTRVP